MTGDDTLGSVLSNIINETRNAAGGIKDFATGLVSPTLRIGVTGLSRAGKTVFITALVHALLHGGKLPLFTSLTKGRINRVYLEPQPNDDVPRFSYEQHVAALTGSDRHWPESTNRLSQLRLTVEYEASGLLARNVQGSKLHIDIIDYPGEWLLDLPLMTQTYAQWSLATLKASEREPRASLATKWLSHLKTIVPEAPADEATAQEAAKLFTDYLASCRADDVSLSTLPPGRFLMPGDLAGSPLLTFAPLAIDSEMVASEGSLHAMMERRYNAYVSRIVEPFFFDHFARLDRQIVLVDTLSALNAGAAAVRDLKVALTDVLSCFRQGANSWASSVFGRRVDRILFAATKADMLHHSSHDKLEKVLQLIVEDAVNKAQFAGAEIDVAAIAAIRATREASVKQSGETLECIAGFPIKGEEIAGEVFDGKSEAAIFPGDLPENPVEALDGSLEGELKFVRFLPPDLGNSSSPVAATAFPHIRLDRALEFLVGDRLK
ncbi:MAG: YcjX family protein [Anderseniella sp.]